MSNPQQTPSLSVPLTQGERELYSQLFKSLDPESTGVVTGDKARATFEKSGLPANILGEIWQLADSSNLGFLTQYGFCYAMRLIGHTQAGRYPAPQLAETPGPLPVFAGLPRPAPPARSASTSSSLLQPQPSSLIPQNTATQQTQPLLPLAPITRDEYERFAQVYVKTTGSAAAELDGNAAKLILMKAKLPTATLGQVWGLVDVHNRGRLDLPAFVMAMHLIHGLLSGTLKQLPPFLPEHVWKSVDNTSEPRVQNALQDRQVSSSSVGSQLSTVRHAPLPASEWLASPLQKQQFDSIFSNLDKSHSGALAADQVAAFLMTSRLDQQDLAAIWDLADIQNTGVFGRLEFAIALFLINRRRAGGALPDIVPQELIASLLESQPQAPQNEPQPQAPNLPLQPVLNAPTQAKSSLDELADIFGSPSPAPAAAALSAGSPQNLGLQQRSSSSDLSQSYEAPRMRLQLTSSFKPSSSFGQSLVTGNRPQHSSESTDIVGGDASAPQNLDDALRSLAPPSQPHGPQFTADKINPESPAKKNTVDYEALRSVPAPPQPRLSNPVSPAPVPQRTTSQRVMSPLRNLSQSNNDLLADSEVSGKLSEATSDIANFSNQIKSLSTQTSHLHDKKLRAEKELARILTVKEEINTKLKLLRTSYTSEVKQVEQVELNLSNAREELEALRSEASIAEAKLNSVSNDFNEKQLAAEENRKTNTLLKEKLGNLNAEIALLESEFQKKTAENVTLSNEANVRKSQVQVALVKVDELKHKISEAVNSHQTYISQINEYERQRLDAELQANEMSNQHRELSQNLNEAKLKHLLLASGIGAAAGLAIGAGARMLVAKDEDDNKTVAHDQTEDEQPMENEGNKLSDTSNKAKASTFESEDINPQTGSTSFSVAGMVDEVKQHPSKDLTGLDSDQDAENKDSLCDEKDYGTPRNNTMQSDPTFYSVAGMVDEVKQHPATDLTGLNDIKDSEHEESQLTEEEAEFMKERFPPVPLGYNNSDHLSAEYKLADYQEMISKDTLASSTATDFQRQTEGETGETPITTPSNSEYRFQSSNAGVVGGMVGMPGVLVGVQRTDSLTSSVQNNPSMSVRDDNIDEISDRDTLEDTADFTENPSKESKPAESLGEDHSEGERLSSGVELFELVNSEEARGVDRSSSRALDAPPHPLAQSYEASNLSRGSESHKVEEFPSPRELDYDESSSDESSPDESENIVAASEEFDDANETLPKHVQAPPEFDSEFDFKDLEPATNEPGKSTEEDEFFDEDFDNLKLANDDNQDDIDAHDVSIDDHFTGADNFGDFAQKSGASAIPDFSGMKNENNAADNDEWEQLFAGFGNETPAAQLQTLGNMPVSSTHETAVQELTAMGFEKDAVIEALERENFDVEAATNYLLDHA